MKTIYDDDAPPGVTLINTKTLKGYPNKMMTGYENKGPICTRCGSYKDVKPIKPGAPIGLCARCNDEVIYGVEGGTKPTGIIKMKSRKEDKPCQNHSNS
jgi:hypothetical protein